MRVLKEYENSSNFVFLSLRNTYTHWFLIHSFIYNIRQYQRIAKTCFSLSMLDGFLKFKKEIRGFGQKILRNIAIKLLTGELRKLCAILIKIWKYSYFELNIWKNMQEM